MTLEIRHRLPIQRLSAPSSAHMSYGTFFADSVGLGKRLYLHITWASLNIPKTTSQLVCTGTHSIVFLLREITVIKHYSVQPLLLATFIYLLACPYTACISWPHEVPPDETALVMFKLSSFQSVCSVSNSINSSIVSFSYLILSVTTESLPCQS